MKNLKNKSILQIEINSLWSPKNNFDNIKTVFENHLITKNLQNSKNIFLSLS